MSTRDSESGDVSSKLGKAPRTTASQRRLRRFGVRRLAIENRTPLICSLSSEGNPPAIINGVLRVSESVIWILGSCRMEFERGSIVRWLCATREWSRTFKLGKSITSNPEECGTRHLRIRRPGEPPLLAELAELSTT